MKENRNYQKAIEENRFNYFDVEYKETNLLIGVDHESFSDEMVLFSLSKIKEFRQQLEDYLQIDPIFGNTLIPHPVRSQSPEIAKLMANAASKASVGPMAAVAGAFSQIIGNELLNNFDIKELFIENSGDIFIKIENPLTIAVLSEKSPLSGKIGIEIPAIEKQMGICTTLGNWGPKISFGNADVVMIASNDAATADAWATAISNNIKTPNDIEKALADIEKITEIRSAIIIFNEKIGVKGNFVTRLINRE